MSKPFFFRSILALTLIAGVSACQSTGMPVYEVPVSVASGQGLKAPTLMPDEPALPPVDVAALRDAFIKSDPSRDFLFIEGYRIPMKGLSIWRDGRAIHHTGPHTIYTEVTSMEGNKMCLAPTRQGYTGLCMEFFKAPNGRLRVYYKYGTGLNGQFIVKNIKVRLSPTDRVRPPVAAAPLSGQDHVQAVAKSRVTWARHPRPRPRHSSD